MDLDYSKLKGRITEKFSTQYLFARAMGWSSRTASLKLNGLTAWKQPEISKALVLLNLTEKDIGDYFFKKKVQNIEHSVYYYKKERNTHDRNTNF